MFSVTHNGVATMRLPGPPVRMLSNNLPQAGVICTLQMYRVFGQIAMGLAHTWGDMPITGVTFAPGKKHGNDNTTTGGAQARLVLGHSKYPSHIIACHPLKDDMACGPHGSSLCFCITAKDTTASGVVLRAQQAISSWKEDMAYEVHDLAAMRLQTMRASTLQAAAGTRANVCPRSSSPGKDARGRHPDRSIAGEGQKRPCATEPAAFLAAIACSETF